MGIRSVKEKRDKEARQKVKKIVIEFLVFVTSTLIRYGAQIAVFMDALIFNEKLQINLNAYEKTQEVNLTSKISYCIPKTWKHNEINDEIRYYRGITYTFGFFVSGSGIIALVHWVLWSVFLYRILKDTEYPNTNGKSLAQIVRIKVGFIESIIHDMPLSVLAISLLASRSGSNGLTCLMCATISNCIDAKQVTDMTSPASIILGFSLMVIAFTTIWRGTTIFFQWSYTNECPAVTVRGFTSIFVGIIYCVLILTPAFFAVKYQLHSMLSTDILGLIEKLIIIGIIEWCLLVLTTCCCPLIKAIS